MNCKLTSLTLRFHLDDFKSRRLKRQSITQSLALSESFVFASIKWVSERWHRLFGSTAKPKTPPELASGNFTESVFLCVFFFLSVYVYALGRVWP